MIRVIFLIRESGQGFGWILQFVNLGSCKLVAVENSMKLFELELNHNPLIQIFCSFDSGVFFRVGWDI